MKCALFLAGGVEECEALITVDLLRRADIEVYTVAIGESLYLMSSHGVGLRADILFDEFLNETFDVLILPGGKAGTANLEASELLIRALESHMDAGKLTAAICAAPSILGHLGYLKGKQYTCFPEFDGDYGGTYHWEPVVRDGNLITGRGMGAALEFGRELIKALAPEKLDAVDYGIQYEHRFRELQQQRVK